MIPSDLSGIFKKILYDLANTRFEDDRSKSLQLFQWLCFARTHFSVPELREAMNMSTNTHCSSLAECLSSPHPIRDDEEMKRRLRSLSGGLAEIKMYGRASWVQLIHQSVKDYLVDEGFQILDSSLQSGDIAIGQAHFRLSRACLRYVLMDDIVQRLRTSPLYYAIDGWLLHAEEAEKMKISQEDILTSFKWPESRISSSWVEIYRETGLFLLWPTPKTTLLHATSRHGLTSAVKAQLWHVTIFCAILLFLAFECMFTPLVISDFSRRLLRLYSLCNDQVDSKDANGRTPLSWAAARGHEAVVKLLLATDGVDPNSKDNKGRTPLSWAVAEGHEAIVRLLLANGGVDPDSGDNGGHTPLLIASSQGFEVIVELLLKKGADILARDRKGGRTPLHWAARNGHNAVVKKLLDNGADCTLQDYGGRTPLHLSVYYEQTEVVQLLAAFAGQQRRACLNFRDAFGLTALHLAVWVAEWHEMQAVGLTQRNINNIGKIMVRHLKEAASSHVPNLSDKTVLDQTDLLEQTLKKVNVILEDQEDRLTLQYMEAWRYIAGAISNFYGARKDLWM